MNDIINKLLLAGDKFMPGLTYSACGPFIKNKQRIQRFLETGDRSVIFKNKLDEACFQHDMAFNFKDLKRKTFADSLKRQSF